MPGNYFDASYLESNRDKNLSSKSTLKLQIEHINKGNESHLYEI